MLVQTLEPLSVQAELGSSPRGLSSEEVAERRTRVGPNELPPARSRSILSELGAQFTNMFAVVLMAASAITFLTYLFTTPRELGEPRAGDRHPRRGRPQRRHRFRPGALRRAHRRGSAGDGPFNGAGDPGR